MTNLDRIRYGIVDVGPDQDPFDDTPPTHKTVASAAELEVLLGREGRTLSDTHRCPHCGTRLVQTSSMIMFLPQPLRSALFCGNDLCESKGQYLPVEDGKLRRLSQEEWNQLKEDSKRREGGRR